MKTLLEGLCIQLVFWMEMCGQALGSCRCYQYVDVAECCLSAHRNKLHWGGGGQAVVEYFVRHSHDVAPSNLGQ